MFDSTWHCRNVVMISFTFDTYSGRKLTKWAVPQRSWCLQLNMSCFLICLHNNTLFNWKLLIVEISSMNVVQRNLLIECTLVVMSLFSATAALQLYKIWNFSAQTLSHQWQSFFFFFYLSTKGNIHRFIPLRRNVRVHWSEVDIKELRCLLGNTETT